jgi:hypothetical protein
MFTNKINFGNLGNCVTVGDTFKILLKMNYPEIRQIAENTTVNLLLSMCVTN